MVRFPPDWAGQQQCRPVLDVDHEVVSGRIDQPGQGRERRLPPSGVISADHTVCVGGAAGLTGADTRFVR